MRLKPIRVHLLKKFFCYRKSRAFTDNRINAAIRTNRCPRHIFNPEVYFTWIKDSQAIKATTYFILQKLLFMVRAKFMRFDMVFHTSLLCTVFCLPECVNFFPKPLRFDTGIGITPVVGVVKRGCQGDGSFDTTLDTKMDEATPHLHIDFIPYTTGSKRGVETRVSLKQTLAAQGFKGGMRQETEWSQRVTFEKELLVTVMERYGIGWLQKGTHET